MTGYVKCPKCGGMGEHHDETMDLGKEQLITCDLCKGWQEVIKQPRSAEFIFAALACMGNASHQMAWANTEISDIEEVPEEIKVQMKKINQKIHGLQEKLRDVRKGLI